MDVMAVTKVKIPKILCNINQYQKSLQRNLICITDSYHDFIIDEIKRKDNIEYERDMSVDDNEEQFTRAQFLEYNA